jgi:2-polyprenyl-6-methoxyphenol hydroxylase-like FAD-dependent oxidoreductase
MKAIIIGGGIAGLASALALTRRGWQAEVLERAPEFTEAGAGLSLWPNVLRALDALGVGEPVRGRAHAGRPGRHPGRRRAVAVPLRYRGTGTPLRAGRHDSPRQPARRAAGHSAG